MVLPGAGAAAWQTNQAELDQGICGTNLQIGSDTAASSTAKPTFLLWGDGGLSSYTISIDGNPIGTLDSTGRGHVCIAVLVPLADGAHVLTGTELAPHAGSAVIPFSFTVDTVPPPSPSQPVLSGYTDSGVEGDGVTRYRQLNFTGTAGANLPMQLLSGIAGFGEDQDRRLGDLVGDHREPPRRHLRRDGHHAGQRREQERALAWHDGHGRHGRARDARQAEPRRHRRRPDPRRPGTVGTDVARIVVFGDGAQIGTATPDAAHNWRFTLPTLDAGPHAVSVAAAERPTTSRTARPR